MLDTILTTLCDTTGDALWALKARAWVRRHDVILAISPRNRSHQEIIKRYPAYLAERLVVLTPRTNYPISVYVSKFQTVYPCTWFWAG